MGTLKLSWRNVWRNKRRSIVTIIAMTVALCVMVLYGGLAEGYMVGMERNILDLEVGDIQVFAEGYLDRPSIYTSIPDSDARVQAFAGAGLTATARLLGGGLAAANDSSAGVSLRGVDPQRDARVSGVAGAVDRGEWLDPADPLGVVVGRRLAKTLSIGPGDELILLSQAADGSLANDLFRVRGVLKVISDGVDRGAVFLTEGAFRELMAFPAGAHQIILRKPAESTLAAAESIARREGRGLDVKTWRQLMPTIANMLESARGMLLIVFVIIYLAVGILILNAMLMAVFERIREFGVLKALGKSPWGVFKLIMTESLIQTGMAVLAGLALAAPGMWYLAKHGVDTGKMGGMAVMGLAIDPIWYGVYSSDSLAGPVVTLLVIAGLAVLYPALKAAWIRPVQAMHHQ